LNPGSVLTLEAQRVVLAPLRRLKVVSRDPDVKVALRFRREGAPAGTAPGAPQAATPAAWTLTVVVIVKPRSLDYVYLAESGHVVEGRIEPQRIFRIGDGLETGLSPEGGVVREIIIQDEGDAELLLMQEGDGLRLSVVPPAFGGKPSGAPNPWWHDEPLRFLNHGVLLGGYAAAFQNDYTDWLLAPGTTEHLFAEAWVANRVGLRAALFSFARESFGVERLVVTQQALRGERWSLWAEAGVAASQRSLTPAQGASSQQSALGWTAGVTGHLRFDDLGASVHWADTGGPSVTQLLAGWQATRRLGIALSWISYRSASATGVALSIGY
jgi:hypothetical protein